MHGTSCLRQNPGIKLLHAHGRRTTRHLLIRPSLCLKSPLCAVHSITKCLQGPSAVQAAPQPHQEDLHPHMGLAGDLGAVHLKRFVKTCQHGIAKTACTSACCAFGKMSPLQAAWGPLFACVLPAYFMSTGLRSLLQPVVETSTWAFHCAVQLDMQLLCDLSGMSCIGASWMMAKHSLVILMPRQLRQEALAMTGLLCSQAMPSTCETRNNIWTPCLLELLIADMTLSQLKRMKLRADQF